MNFPSIDIQGSIISTDLLSKIRTEQANYQQGKDFIKDYTNARLKDEISSAWQDAKGQWTIFQNKLSRLNEKETATTETRNFWIIPLLSNLGYNLNFSRQAEELNGKSFPISYRDSIIDGFPVYIGGFNESLDKRPENKQLRVSPHAMLQEYLNYSEHLYGLVTNGKQLRLLRDASRITRLSYVEFNLQKMMEEDLYSDFVLLYRLLHTSRMPQKMDGGAESIIEKYHHEGLEAGSTIRNKLGNAVKDSIKALANGFINHPDNSNLRTAMQEGKLNADDFYHHQLRIIYRLLFLFVIEERNLVYAESKTPETKRFNHIYFNYYSLLRLRKLAKKLPPPDAHRHYDLWQSLLNTFALFENKTMGEKLGIMSLQGDLFSTDAIGNYVYDLHQCRLSNAVLMKVLKDLGYFENENGVLIAVNYGGLDVEEFGSVYEGLLELKLKIEPIAGSDTYSCAFDSSTERSKSGSHYTPEELVQPLIKHSLEYLIEDILLLYYQKKVNKENTIKALLKLKVCDVACGSGHILLSAARRIALAVARVQTDEDQPNPLAVRKAMKDVVRNCIYGVDKNPLAVELCKVALWLEAHNPGEPLNFLDHHIKCGDAIVGLAHREELENGIADEAFKTLPGDDKDIAKLFRDQNSRERKIRTAKETQLKAEFEKTTASSVEEAMAEYKIFNRLPETTPDEIERKAKAYRKFMDGKGFTFLKAMADTQIAQFFIPKTTENKDSIMTDTDFLQILSGYKGWQDRKIAKATVVAFENRFFHWFLEFPEVFNEGGFDCILGNPPFLGGQGLSGILGIQYLNWITSSLNVAGNCDLVVSFLIRDYQLIKRNAFISIISTKGISEGANRINGLERICKDSSIVFAIKSLKWPGIAKLQVSLFSISNKKWQESRYLNNKKVVFISSFLDDINSIAEPNALFTNKSKIFNGSFIYGDGFIIDKIIYNLYIEDNVNNKKVLYKIINGNDINNCWDFENMERYVINFFDLPYEKAKEFSMPFLKLESDVYPERQKQNRESRKKYWWHYGEKTLELFKRLSQSKYCLGAALTTKYLIFEKLPSNVVFTHATAIIPNTNFTQFSILCSCFKNDWSFKYSSALGNTLRYTPSTSFETFPFPQNLSPKQEQHLEQIGEQYHEHRKQLMLNMQLGLTKTYNAFHAREIQPGITNVLLKEMDKKAIEKQYGKEVWNLWNHLQKTKDVCSIEEAIAGIVKLRELHVEMDEAVLEAYGWSFDSAAFDSAQAPGIHLRHDFYEVDYLPENDRVRFTIHPDARKEILKRLLELNHKIHEEEVAAGLWDKKKPKDYKTAKSKASTANEAESIYKQQSLFEEDNLFNQ